jgi:hypothetical protein
MDIQHVYGNLYISGLKSLIDGSLSKSNITHVINLSNREIQGRGRNKDDVAIWVYNVMNIVDLELRKKEEVYDYIMKYMKLIDLYDEICDTYSRCECGNKNLLKQPSILINCAMGINRSGLLVCLLLCFRYGFKAIDAKQHLVEVNKRRSRQALVNLSFNQILVFCDGIIKNEGSVQIVDRKNGG